MGGMGNPSKAFGVSIGDRIELLSMQDRDAVAPGSKGTVVMLCDTPGLEQIVVDWDSGRGLAVIPGVDKFRRI
jgi:hypothetical protein